jgi:SAM-dependent methyltransferase
MKQAWPAPERNKQPILDVLRRVLPERCSVLEISSGSGQHAAFFAAEQPSWTWQPSDLDPENLASIAAWVSEAQRPNLRAPLRIDVLDADWGLGTVDAMFCANMIHIAPWACCAGLLTGAARHLQPGGKLVIYGPFSLGGVHTAESNAAFDASLKARNPSWGVRDADDVIALAAQHGLRFIERVPMPANNQSLVFERT